MNWQTKNKLKNARIVIAYIALISAVGVVFAFQQGLFDFSPNKKLSSLFSATFSDLKSENIPSDFSPTGDKAFSYDLNTNKYTYRYIPKEMKAVNANEVKYVVLYKVEEIHSGPYIRSKYKHVDIKIIDTDSKKVIGHNSFDGPTSNRGARLPKEAAVMDWIITEIKAKAD